MRVCGCYATNYSLAMMASFSGSDSEDDALELAVVGLLATLEPEKTKRSCWVRPWIARREEVGAYNSLMRELELEDPSNFHNFLRMDKTNFDLLLERVTPLIAKTDTPMRNALPAGEKLALTLRYLASGDSYKSMEFLYRVPKNTISKLVPEVCKAIYSTLKENYMKIPQTESEWKTIADDFQDTWQFPHCIGAMDGKHISIRAPKRSGSTFYNYKNYFSIVLLALVDANYKFIYVDVGSNGRVSDAGIFANSTLHHALESNTLNIPSPSPLEGRYEPVPYVIVGDDAFPLKQYIMKPFPFRDASDDKKIFNYRLSRARRVSENAFGILTSRFGVFNRSMGIDNDTGKLIVLACVALHNFLRTRCDVKYVSTPAEGVCSDLGSTRDTPFLQQGGNRSTQSARDIRDELADYFVTNGQVDWQWDHVL